MKFVTKKQRLKTSAGFREIRIQKSSPSDARTHTCRHHHPKFLSTVQHNKNNNINRSNLIDSHWRAQNLQQSIMFPPEINVSCNTRILVITMSVSTSTTESILTSTPMRMHPLHKNHHDNNESESASKLTHIKSTHTIEEDERKKM